LISVKYLLLEFVLIGTPREKSRGIALKLTQINKKLSYSDITKNLSDIYTSDLGFY